jgi:hypothetical protein
MKLELSRQIFEKYSNIKFHENPSVGAELFRADRRAELIDVFRNFANVPTNRFSALTIFQIIEPNKRMFCKCISSNNICLSERSVSLYEAPFCGSTVEKKDRWARGCYTFQRRLSCI